MESNNNKPNIDPQFHEVWDAAGQYKYSFENINNTNCLPYVKANLKTFVPNIVSMCETNDGTINNTDICNYVYTDVDTLKDSVIKASKDRIDIENCKKNILKNN